MHLKKLILTNFKNYESQTLDLSPRLNCFVGRNGMGKTNILDAVWYLCMCKSHFTNNDRQVQRHKADFFRLEGQFERAGKKEKIVTKVKARKLKAIERNDVGYKRFSEHIGLFPVVMVAPDDTDLARDGSEERRRFLDNTLSQLDPLYLNALIAYNRLLKQRNALLKKFASEGGWNVSLLRTYDEQMLAPAAKIHEVRAAFMAEFQPILQAHYAAISAEQEEVTCIYTSKLTEHQFKDLLTETTDKDRILQRTTTGVHRDDLLFKINGFALKNFASQGQLKSYVLALKLAQYEVLRRQKDITPLLLLDDIFDKLDSNRVQQLLTLLLTNEFGQIFITDTHEQRLSEILDGKDYKKFRIENGKAELVE